MTDTDWERLGDRWTDHRDEVGRLRAAAARAEGIIATAAGLLTRSLPRVPAGYPRDVIVEAANVLRSARPVDRPEPAASTAVVIYRPGDLS